ncbi:hypothetical protein HDU96_003476 [Phlyctochytrium bullatum]|nr:hypothetical protein HDU96_003476 [Phlyctochytrium bullatum]
MTSTPHSESSTFPINSVHHSPSGIMAAAVSAAAIHASSATIPFTSSVSHQRRASLPSATTAAPISSTAATLQQQQRPTSLMVTSSSSSSLHSHASGHGQGHSEIPFSRHSARSNCLACQLKREREEKLRESNPWVLKRNAMASSSSNGQRSTSKSDSELAYRRKTTHRAPLSRRTSSDVLSPTMSTASSSSTANPRYASIKPRIDTGLVRGASGKMVLRSVGSSGNLRTGDDEKRSNRRSQPPPPDAPPHRSSLLPTSTRKPRPLSTPPTAAPVKPTPPSVGYTNPRMGARLSRLAAARKKVVVVDAAEQVASVAVPGRKVLRGRGDVEGAARAAEETGVKEGDGEDADDEGEEGEKKCRAAPVAVEVEEVEVKEVEVTEKVEVEEVEVTDEVEVKKAEEADKEPVEEVAVKNEVEDKEAEEEVAVKDEQPAEELEVKEDTEVTIQDETAPEEIPVTEETPVMEEEAPSTEDASAKPEEDTPPAEETLVVQVVEVVEVVEEVTEVIEVIDAPTDSPPSAPLSPPTVHIETDPSSTGTTAVASPTPSHAPPPTITGKTLTILDTHGNPVTVTIPAVVHLDDPSGFSDTTSMVSIDYDSDTPTTATATTRRFPTLTRTSSAESATSPAPTAAAALHPVPIKRLKRRQIDMSDLTTLATLATSRLTDLRSQHPALSRSTSAASSPASLRRPYLSAAREIAVLGAGIATAWQPVARACGADTRLRDRLLASLTALESLAGRMRVLVRMRGGSLVRTDAEVDADGVVLSCAEAVVGAAKEAVRDLEAARVMLEAAAAAAAAATNGEEGEKEGNGEGKVEEREPGDGGMEAAVLAAIKAGGAFGSR